MEIQFYVKILKIHFNDNHYTTILGSYQTTIFGREDVAYKCGSGHLKIMKICPTDISNNFDQKLIISLQIMSNALHLSKMDTF